MLLSRLIAGRDEKKCVGRSHIKAVSGERDRKVILRPISHGGDLPPCDEIQLSCTPWEQREKINAGTLRVGRRYRRTESSPRQPRECWCDSRGRGGEADVLRPDPDDSWTGKGRSR